MPDREALTRGSVPDWVTTLEARIVELRAGREWFDVDGTLPELAEVEDENLKVLLGVVQEEGLRRGFGSYWWE